MNSIISARHMNVPKSFKQYAHKKLNKLPRYYDDTQEIELVIEQNNGNSIELEIVARAKHNHTFIATEKNEDIYACFNRAVHRLKRQLRKQKEKERCQKAERLHKSNNNKP